MERETKTFKTTSGQNTLILYAYATGREVRAIDTKYISAMKVDIKSGEPSMNDVNMSVMYDAENLMIQHIVVSLNDSKDNIIERILDLPQDEYAEIIKELSSITKKKST